MLIVRSPAIQWLSTVRCSAFQRCQGQFRYCATVLEGRHIYRKLCSMAPGFSLVWLPSWLRLLGCCPVNLRFSRELCCPASFGLPVRWPYFDICNVASAPGPSNRCFLVASDPGPPTWCCQCPWSAIQLNHDFAACPGNCMVCIFL